MGRGHATAAVYAAIAVVSLLHYLAPVHAHQLHDIYRRLYYLPIIVAAFLHGWRGGLVAAAAVCAAYLPHALGHISHDPASDTQKSLEMLLYFAVGGVTGSLVSRLQRTQRELTRATEDLTASLAQLKEAEQQLVQSARLAAVGRLSAGLAHEIRNPLASIKGSAEILADDFPGAHPKHRLLRVLIDESARLNNVLTRFLAFARPRPMSREPVAVGAELEAVASLLQNEGPSPGGVELDCGDGDGLEMEGDREQLRQVLLNVLLNARQASPPGAAVRVRCRREGGLLRISVRDGGAGFSPEALENAFTPFFTTKPEGSGLGLAISHRIVEQHGGVIRAGNHPGGGGLVEIELPCRAS